MKKRVYLIVITFSLLLIAACGGNTQSAAKQDKELEALIKLRCTSCHTVDRITAGQPKENWPDIVDRMISLGSGVQPDQRDELVAYLQEVYSK